MTEEKNEQPREGETPEAKVDYEAKMKELETQKQSEIDRLNRELRQKEEQLDYLTPYVDFAEATGQKATEPDASDGEYVDKKTVAQELQKIQATNEAKLAAIQFRVDNPDLKTYEKSLVGPAVKRLIEANPYMPRDQVLEKAAKEVRDFLASEREKGKAEAEAKEKERKDEVAAASGLGSAKDTAPEQLNEGESAEEYIKARRERLSKMKSPARVVG